MSATSTTRQHQAFAAAPVSPAAPAASRPRSYGNPCGAASVIADGTTRAMGLGCDKGMGWLTVHASFKTPTRRLERSLT